MQKFPRCENSGLMHVQNNMQNHSYTNFSNKEKYVHPPNLMICAFREVRTEFNFKSYLIVHGEKEAFLFTKKLENLINKNTLDTF